MKPKMIIYRGLPGAGKDTHIAQFQKALALEHCDLKVFSADDFWYRNPERTYQFDPKRIGEAHTSCFSGVLNCLEHRFQFGCQHPAPYIVVNNTNISAYEIAPYIALANSYGLDHQILTIWCDPMVAARRNIHQVPVEVVFSMYQRLLEENLPPLWKHQIVLPEE